MAGQVPGRSRSGSGSTGRGFPAASATRLHRRCLPTGRGWWAGRSSITGRGEYSRRVQRSRTRSLNSEAAPSGNRTPRQRLPNSLTGLRPPARTIGARSASTCSPSTTSCRPSSQRGSTTRPSCGRNPSGKGSTSRSSGPRPVSAACRCNRTRTATTRDSSIATCWSSVPVRPGCRRPWPPEGRVQELCWRTRISASADG